MIQDPLPPVSELTSIPEIQVLQTCARRTGIRMGLRGGVLRNLLLTFNLRANDEPSLYDFVDPFSDLDVVVEDPLDWPPLWEAIQSALPFAGFHRWEARPLGQIRRAVTRFEDIPIDRFLLWFDAAEPGELSLDALGMSAQEAWRRHQAMEDENLLPQEWLERPDRAAILLAELKTLRYYFQYPENIRPVTPGMIEQLRQLMMGTWNRAREIPFPEARTPAFQTRLELAVLDLLFTTREWDASLAELRSLRQFVPDELLRPFSLLKKVFDEPDIKRARRVGASVYRPAPRASLELRIHFASSDDGLEASAATRGTGLTRITPWTPLTVSDPDLPGDCCRYRDFRNGAAIIAWRDRRGRLGGSEDPSRLALAARINADVPYPPKTADGFEDAFSFPGFVTTGQALTARLDHGYVRAVAGRDVTFEAAVLRSEPP